MSKEESKNNIETTKTREIAKEINSPKEKLQKIFENSKLKIETIENLKKIISLVDINEINDFIIGEPDLDDSINKGLEIDLSIGIEQIIDDFLIKFGEAKTDLSTQEKFKKENFEEKKGEISSDTMKQEEIEDSSLLDLKEKQKEGIDLINKNDLKYRELFKGDSNILQILDDIKANEKNPTEVARLLNDFLSNKESATKFFDKIAATGDSTLYSDTIQSFKNIGVNIPPYITGTIYEVKSITGNNEDSKKIISQFPDAKEGEITKRGDIVSFGDKTIDLRDKKAYISGENGYKLETSISLPDTLDLKAEYLARKLEIKETINTDKRILELLGNKKKIKQDIADLEKQKKGGLGEDTGVNIAINLLQKELEQIQAKLAVAVPNYKENQDDLLTSFLENSIKENEEKLNKLEGKYRKDLSELYEKSADKVRENDEATRETTRFLALIGFSSLPQEITDKIINNIINTSKRNENQIAELGFVANLKPGKSDFLGLNGLVGEDIVKQKKAFVKMFNKMMTGETEKPIPTSDNDLLNQEKEISNKYKQEINGILFKDPFEGNWKQGIMEDNLFKTNKKETTNKETK